MKALLYMLSFFALLFLTGWVIVERTKNLHFTATQMHRNGVIVENVGSTICFFMIVAFVWVMSRAIKEDMKMLNEKRLAKKL